MTSRLNRRPAGPQKSNEEYRRNQHGAASGGISGVLDTGQAGTGQPHELQHSGRQRSGTDWPRMSRSVCRAASRSRSVVRLCRKRPVSWAPGGAHGSCRDRTTAMKPATSISHACCVNRYVLCNRRGACPARAFCRFWTLNENARNPSTSASSAALSLCT